MPLSSDSDDQEGPSLASGYGGDDAHIDSDNDDRNNY